MPIPTYTIRFPGSRYIDVSSGLRHHYITYRSIFTYQGIKFWNDIYTLHLIYRKHPHNWSFLRKGSYHVNRHLLHQLDAHSIESTLKTFPNHLHTWTGRTVEHDHLHFASVQHCHYAIRWGILLDPVLPWLPQTNTQTVPLSFRLFGIYK